MFCINVLHDLGGVFQFLSASVSLPHESMNTLAPILGSQFYSQWFRPTFGVADSKIMLAR